MKETYKKMTKEELEREYYSHRPTEPYSEDDSPNDWANIAQYAEENLDKAFKAIAELEKAKEIIKDYMIITKGSHTTVCGVPEENRTIDVLKLNKEAEQFIKE